MWLCQLESVAELLIFFMVRISYLELEVGLSYLTICSTIKKKPPPNMLNIIVTFYY